MRDELRFFAVWNFTQCVAPTFLSSRLTLLEDRVTNLTARVEKLKALYKQTMPSRTDRSTLAAMRDELEYSLGYKSRIAGLLNGTAGATFVPRFEYQKRLLNKTVRKQMRSLLAAAEHVEGEGDIDD
jgi:hypothetical protein